MDMTEDDKKELLLLRELAANSCSINKVISELGPLSLWSKDAFERELSKARSEEREALVALAAAQGRAMKNEDPFEDAVREICAMRSTT